MSGPTPGPWRVEWPEPESTLAMVEGPVVLGPENQPVAEVLSADVALDARFATHDARLIAAAPELLEAAHAVDVVYAELAGALPKLAEESPDGWRAVMDAVSAARAAIAKATEES